jgi:hypothetical protein
MAEQEKRHDARSQAENGRDNRAADIVITIEAPEILSGAPACSGPRKAQSLRHGVRCRKDE